MYSSNLKFIDRSSHGKQNLFKKNDTDAGYDICASVGCIIPERSSCIIPTGVFIEIPEHSVAILKSRSGLSVKNKIEVGAGVIDSSYRGEVMVHLYNHGLSPFTVKPGDRIAQLLVVPIILGDFHKVEELSSTDRGEKGFGSSGV